ncbi:hypothetical protein GCM10009555_034750 [Acrocarpospora macrocephala]|uniref:Uncharacterized protein n=1 Tax=Acrocarpospora macrocephala TaxID=150177 RepID=A0A5M3WCU2_9ACTN|nr:hypothetical protein [Acrocarpospora macrocephala]GES06656.1 hypothetical protein Amac_002510 [Acrocarpospora macrocephala]
MLLGVGPGVEPDFADGPGVELALGDGVAAAAVPVQATVDPLRFGVPMSRRTTSVMAGGLASSDGDGLGVGSASDGLGVA